MATISEELERLNELHRAGGLTDDELAQAKAKLLAPAPIAPWAKDKEARELAMILHFSQWAGFAIPFAGLIAPIAIWQSKKNEMPMIDEHGKVVVNWIISSIIYAVVSFLLMFVVVGVFLLIALGILWIVFPLLGGLKANKGEVWKYPLSITFVK